MTWRLSGEFFENCNCEILCPCITSADQWPADYERCLVPMICHIDEGYLDDLRLDDLNIAYIVDSPAVMGTGNWRLGLYLDAHASSEQQDGLERILKGRLSGPPEGSCLWWARILAPRSIANVLHPMGDVLPIARARAGVIDDADFAVKFDNTGKNAHYRRFSWRG